MAYARTAEQRARDLKESRDFEKEVRSHLGPFVFDDTQSTERMDFMVPPVIVEVKEKKQRLTDRWWLLDGVPERELFVLDELTVRKACDHWPWVYFVLRDVPGGRLFLVSLVELICTERTRVDRVGGTGHRKGKWILDLSKFREIRSLDGLEDLIREDIVAKRWKNSEALSQIPVRTV